MAVINVGDNKRKKACRAIINYSKKWWVKFLVVPILFIGPLSALNFILSKNEIGAKILAFLPKDFADFISHSSIVILAALWLLVTLFRAVLALIEEYSLPERALKIDDLVAILSAVQIAVDGKCVRFHETVKSHKDQDKTDPSNIFLTITKPDQQLALITKAIHTVFTEIYSDVNFRVGLIRVINNQSIDWTCFAPTTSPPVTEARDLNAPTSTVAACIKEKGIVIVGDIQKELKKKTKNDRKFVKFNFKDGKNGSQLCCPVFHPVTREIEYVVTVQSDKEKTFTDRHHALYQWILEHFTLRISLEHSLLILREKSNGTT